MTRVQTHAAHAGQSATSHQRGARSAGITKGILTGRSNAKEDPPTCTLASKGASLGTRESASSVARARPGAATVERNMPAGALNKRAARTRPDTTPDALLRDALGPTKCPNRRIPGFSRAKRTISSPIKGLITRDRAIYKPYSFKNLRLVSKRETEADPDAKNILWFCLQKDVSC